MTKVTARPLAIPAEAGERFDFGGFGVRWKIDGHHAEGRFAIVHHPLAPRALEREYLRAAGFTVIDVHQLRHDIHNNWYVAS